MTFKLFRAGSHLHRLFFLALLAAPFGPACSDEDEAPPLPLAFSISVSQLEPGSKLPLRCDGSMAVHVAISSANKLVFALRPSQACGGSNRCGYVRVEGLSGSGEVLAKVDTVTTVGLLEVPSARLPDFVQVRVSLIRGVDDEPLINADKQAVTATVDVESAAPSDCPPEPEGVGGSGQGGNGQGGDSGDTGGQPGAPSGGAPSAGAASSDGGVPGDGGTGSGSAGSPESPNAGAGGI